MTSMRAWCATNCCRRFIRTTTSPRIRNSTLKGDAHVIRDYQVDGRPTYVLIDPTGKIIAYAPGGLDRMEALLLERLGEPTHRDR